MDFKGWLIYSKQDAERNRTFIDWMKEEANQANMELALHYREDIRIGIKDNTPMISKHKNALQFPDFAINRTPEPSLSVFLESCRIPVYNSAEISAMCNHKTLTHIAMSRLNIPSVNMIFTKKDHVKHTPPIDYPFVVKEATGRSGKQVHLIHSEREWMNCYPQLDSKDLVFQTTNVQHGKDVRVFIIGKEIIGAVMRSSKKGFKANYTLGGNASWYELNEQERNIIQKIIQTYDFGMVGIDFLISEDGHFLFNEIEDVVGSRILSAVSDINIIRKYMSLIKRQLEKVKKS